MLHTGSTQYRQFAALNKSPTPTAAVPYIWMYKKYTAAGTACISTMSAVPSLSGQRPLYCPITSPSGMPSTRLSSMASTPICTEIGSFCASIWVTGAFTL